MSFLVQQVGPRHFDSVLNATVRAAALLPDTIDGVNKFALSSGIALIYFCCFMVFLECDYALYWWLLLSRDSGYYTTVYYILYY